MRRKPAVASFLSLLSLLAAHDSLAQDYFIVTDLVFGGRGSLVLEDVRSVFLGQKMFLSGSQRVYGILAMPEGANVDHFFQDVLGMPHDQYSAYWRRKLFAGKGHPPKEVASDEKALEFVQTNKSSIAVVSRKPRPEMLRGLQVLRVNLAENSLVPVPAGP